MRLGKPDLSDNSKAQNTLSVISPTVPSKIVGFFVLEYSPCQNSLEVQRGGTVLPGSCPRDVHKSIFCSPSRTTKKTGTGRKNNQREEEVWCQMRVRGRLSYPVLVAQGPHVDPSSPFEVVLLEFSDQGPVGSMTPK